ncbi:hypothetical protein ABMA32_03565 [Mesorhizobium sp. VNQ89]|uniref:hypothetical protein n=1 Tax=Mesorhizobium quangtriensis TaxID=3157709 RepID=UPI0032B84246
MAKTALKQVSNRSISEADNASTPAANSPVSVQSENEAVNQHVDRQTLLTTSAPIPSPEWRSPEIVASETPLMRVYREWVAARHHADHVIRDAEGYNSDDERDAFIETTLNPIEERLGDASISSLRDLLARVRVELDYALQKGHDDLLSAIEDYLAGPLPVGGGLSALLDAFKLARVEHLAAIKKTDTTAPGPDHDAAFEAQGTAIHIEDDIVLKICRYQPVNESERFERTSFLREFLADIPPNDEMREALLDRPALPASSPEVASDPLLELIAEYRRQVRIFEAMPDDFPGYASEDAAVDATYGPSMRKLTDECPAPSTLGGVHEAIRYAFETDSLIDRSAESILKAALRFLETAAAEAFPSVASSDAPFPRITDTLATLMTNHRNAMARYSACSDDDWKGQEAAINAAINASRDALFAHRPTSLEEARAKASFLARDKAFSEWDDFEPVKLIHALTPECSPSPIALLIDAHAESFRQLDAACMETDRVAGTEAEAAAQGAQEAASDATRDTMQAIIHHRYSSLDEIGQAVRYIARHYEATGDGNPQAWLTELACSVAGIEEVCA